MNERFNTIRFNLIFWTLYFLYEWLGMGAATDQYYVYFIKACTSVPIAFVVSCLSVHYLFSNFYLSDKKTTFWLGQIVVAVVFVMLKRYINYHYLYQMYYPQGTLKPLIFFPKIIIEFVNLYLIVFLYGTFFFIRSWYHQRQTLIELKQEKTAAELELLKSQVQPHFIFNMLNNIYSGAFKKSPETAQQILKLSNFIEYSLYDSKKEKVTLTEELEYIQNYIALQKIRFGDKLDVSFNVYNAIEGIQIPPLLLLPIIENCFKHGVNKSINASWIRVDIEKKDNELVVKVENSIEEEIEEMASQNGGLGLNNVKRRLEILYPTVHEFKTYREKNSFLVVLKLQINK